MTDGITTHVTHHFLVTVLTVLIGIRLIEYYLYNLSVYGKLYGIIRNLIIVIHFVFFVYLILGLSGMISMRIN